jgi:hypothetical protein
MSDVGTRERQCHTLYAATEGLSGSGCDAAPECEGQPRPEAVRPERAGE